MPQCPFRDWGVGGPRNELSNTPATRLKPAARYAAFKALARRERRLAARNAPADAKGVRANPDDILPQQAAR